MEKFIVPLLYYGEEYINDLIVHTLHSKEKLNATNFCIDLKKYHILTESGF